MTIQEENNKILREPLDVICGVDIALAQITSVSSDDAYFVGNINGVDTNTILMDLSNGGFLSDGNAVPLRDDFNGILSNINQELNIDLELDREVDAGTRIEVYGYIGNSITNWTFMADGGDTQTITIPANFERVHIFRIVFGYSWWFDNNTLVSVNGTLRGVETKVDNPELQISEIEIKGYEPEDITDIIGGIGEDYPIYYSAGYRGDMSPVRHFYMSDQIEWADNVITIKGQDATKFLEGEDNGFWGTDMEYVTKGNMVGQYFNHVYPDFGDREIDVQTIGYPPQGESTTEVNMFVARATYRKRLAMATNLFNDDNNSLFYQYVDAGIPTIMFEDGRRAWDIDDHQIGKIKKIVEPSINKLSMDEYEASIGALEEITSFDVGYAGNMYEYYSSEPIVDWEIRGNVFDGPIRFADTSPYHIRFIASRTGTASIWGKKISQAFNSLSAETEELGVAKVNDPMPKLYLDDTDVTDELLTLDRSNLLYEFDYRGNPYMQPRDIIHLNHTQNIIPDGYVFNEEIEPSTLYEEERNIALRFTYSDGTQTQEFYANKIRINQYGRLEYHLILSESIRTWFTVRNDSTGWLDEQYRHIVLAETPSDEDFEWLKRNSVQDTEVIDMTIDNITFSHENGGYKQTIVARKGVV